MFKCDRLEVHVFLNPACEGLECARLMTNVFGTHMRLQLGAGASAGCLQKGRLPKTALMHIFYQARVKGLMQPRRMKVRTNLFLKNCRAATLRDHDQFLEHPYACESCEPRCQATCSRVAGAVMVGRIGMLKPVIVPFAFFYYRFCSYRSCCRRRRRKVARCPAPRLPRQAPPAPADAPRSALGPAAQAPTACRPRHRRSRCTPRPRTWTRARPSWTRRTCRRCRCTNNTVQHSSCAQPPAVLLNSDQSTISRQGR